MKVTQEKLPDSQVGLEIEIPPEMSQKTYDQVLRKLMKTVNIPGFRKGKVPRQVFLQRVGVSQFKAAVLEELLQDAIDKAIQQEAIEAIGNYQLKSSIDELIGQYEPGKALTVSAAVDVPPRVDLDGYTGLSVQAEEVKYDPERVDKTLEQYRGNLATLVPIEDRTAEMGDVAVVDFVGKVKKDDGELEEFTGGSAEDFQVDLEDGKFIGGFIQGIVGMAIDETKEVEVTFPEDYAQEDLAGQDAVFTITVKEIKARELPEVDDDFAQEISEFETLAELRGSLEERYQREAEEQTKRNKHEALLDALVKNLKAEIPNTMVRQETELMIRQTLIQLSQQGLDINKLITQEMIEGMRERTRPEAIQRLKRTLALGEVAKRESIKPGEEEITAKMQEMAEQIGDPEKIDQARLRQVVEEDLLQEQILDWLESHSTVELVPEGTLAENAMSETNVESAEAPDIDATQADIEVDAKAIEDDSEE
ncbi:trigger factor [filamentous cyanobacterium CCP5]|nr:trigger factor [filamentous cyanobacterium CCP5]